MDVFWQAGTSRGHHASPGSGRNRRCRAIAAKSFERKPAGEVLADRARQLRDEKQIDYRQALSEAVQENPELYDRLREECYADGEIVPGMFASRPRSWELHKKVTARAAEKGISYAAAAKEPEREEPELTAAARTEGCLKIKDTKLLPSGVEMVLCAQFGPDPSAWIAGMAKNRARHKNISYRLALSEISRDYPHIIALARARVMGLSGS